MVKARSGQLVLTAENLLLMIVWRNRLKDTIDVLAGVTALSQIQAKGLDGVSARLEKQVNSYMPEAAMAGEN